ncbi:MAG: phosphate ABC transporter permease subunit PstC [Mariprofundaceae bacterium]
MWLNTATRLSLMLASIVVVVMLTFLINASLPFWQEQGLQSLVGAEWFPYEDMFGMLPALIGTLWSVGLALAIAVPMAVAAAIMTSEMADNRLRSLIRFCMEILAGIPSVVYGLIGLWLLLPWLQSTLNLLSGHSLLAAGILLSLMILPTIMVMAEDAISGIALEQREAAANLGLDWSDRLFRVVLPQAWPGIRAGILLASGRALGETIAVMLVVGSMDRIPDPLYNFLQPAQTLTSRIGREIGEAAFGSLHFSALIACGLILSIISIILSLIAHTNQRETV